MIIKKYSPVKVSNPTSQSHLVLLRPNQDLCLRLNEDADALLFSNYIDEASSVVRNGLTEFCFRQKAEYPIEDWAKISPFYLGEIGIMRGDNISSLFLVCKDRKVLNDNILAVVNPKGHSIKVEPQQTIEVILYRGNVESPDAAELKWEFEFKSGDLDIEYECMKQQTVFPRAKYSGYSRISPSTCVVFPRASEGIGVEHHFWLRLKYKSILELEKVTANTYAVGAMTFRPKLGLSGDVFKLNMFLNIREKSRKQHLKALYAPISYIIVSSIEDIDNENDKRDKIRVIGEKTSTAPAKISLGNSVAWDHDEPYPISRWQDRRNWRDNWGERNNYSINNNLWVQEVSLKSKEVSGIDEGCNIYYCISREIEVEVEDEVVEVKNDDDYY